MGATRLWAHKGHCSELVKEPESKMKSKHLEDMNLKHARLRNGKYVYISVQPTLTLNGRSRVRGKKIEMWSDLYRG